MTEKKPRKQCKACPWKVSTDPSREIPNGYCETRHKALASTIAEPASFRFGGELHIMACHETPVGREIPCVGWMIQQLGEGNNIGLRILVMTGRIDGNVRTVGEQHARLEDTFPKHRKRRK